MKKLLLLLLLAATQAQAIDVKISQLPLAAGTSVGASDSFPFVAATTLVTKRMTLWDIVNLPAMTAYYAPLASPAFTGNPTAATQTLGDNSTRLATTAFCTNAITANSTVPTATIKGRITAGTGLAENLTVTQATSMLNVFGGDSGSGGVKGLVPATVSGDAAKFLRGDGLWSANALAGRTITGTANTITVTNGDGVSGNPTITVADNVVLPGTGSATLPTGTTAQRSGSPVAGMIRYNSDLTQFEGYKGGSWGAIGGARYVTTFTGTSVTPDASSSDQTFLYTGGSAQTFSTTGFGTISSLANGTIIKIMGSSDTNTITIQASDITDGRLINGDAELGKGQAITFEYNSTLARMVETSRNF